jgi:hypothetical protein
MAEDEVRILAEEVAILRAEFEALQVGRPATGMPVKPADHVETPPECQSI